VALNSFVIILIPNPPFNKTSSTRFSICTYTTIVSRFMATNVITWTSASFGTDGFVDKKL
jgi:hypothetical protein